MITTIAPLNELELIDALKAHSRRAYNELYDRYTTALFGAITCIVGNEEEAQDVLQDTFVKVWKNIHQHDPAKGRLFTWLLNVARNTALDHRRSRKNGKKEELQEEMGETTLTPVDQIGFRDSVTTSLSTPHWHVINLVYFQGYTHQEASQYLALPLGTVKTRARMALTQLRGVFLADYQHLFSRDERLYARY